MVAEIKCMHLVNTEHPRDGDKLVEFIKRFVNLNTTLFTRGCKPCKLLKELVDVLEDMPENVREAMC